MMSEEGAAPGRRVEFVRAPLKWRLRVRPFSVRTCGWVFALLWAGGLVAGHWFAGFVIEHHDETMMLTGHVMADGLVRGAIIVTGLYLVFLAVASVPAAGRLRSFWDTMIVDDTGITVSRRGSTQHAPWRDVRSVDVRGDGSRSGLLRTRGFTAELARLQPVGSQPERALRLPRIADTQAYTELVTTHGVSMRRRRLRWTDSFVVVMLLIAALPHLPLNRGAALDYQSAVGTIGGAAADQAHAADAWLTRRPDDGFVRILRAQALASEGRMAEARADADRGVVDDPRCAMTWDLRKGIADLSGDAEWALRSWMQAHPGFSNFDEDGRVSPDEIARWRAEIGRRLFMASDFERARRWLVAAEHEAASMKGHEPMASRIQTLVALCDVAQGRSDLALTSLAATEEDGILRRHVEALALRCLGREQEIDAVLARVPAKPLRSDRMKEANQTIDDWLRGKPVELPSSLAWSQANAILVNLDAPLLALALRRCTTSPP